jgi:hypothetical protein
MATPDPKLDPNNQPWGRWATEEIKSLRADLNRLSTDTNNNLRQLNGNITSLNTQVKALPTTTVKNNSSTNFALTGSFAPYASINFSASYPNGLLPGDKVRAYCFVNISAAALDTTSAGATTAIGRINFGGILSPEFSAAKDAGASVVNNIVSGSYGYFVTLGINVNYTISLELKGLNPTAFPASASNYANIAALINIYVVNSLS